MINVFCRLIPALLLFYVTFTSPPDIGDPGSSSKYSTLESKEAFSSFLDNKTQAYDPRIDCYFYAEDLPMGEEEVDQFQLDGFSDYDNDGKMEMFLKQALYGGMILDEEDGELSVLAAGDGTAQYLQIGYYEGYTWIIFSDVMHAGRETYDMYKYDGTEIVDEKMLSAEYWESNDPYGDDAVFMFDGTEITMEEFEDLKEEILYSDWR